MSIQHSYLVPMASLCPPWHDFEPEFDWTIKEMAKEKIGNRMQHFEDERDTKRKKNQEIEEKNKEKMQ